MAHESLEEKFDKAYIELGRMYARKIDEQVKEALEKEGLTHL